MITTGQTVILVSGDPVALDAYEGVINETIVIKADPDNTGEVAVGDDRVRSDIGYVLDPGDTITITYGGDLGAIYIVSDVAGNRVSWIACGSI